MYLPFPFTKCERSRWKSSRQSFVAGYLYWSRLPWQRHITMTSLVTQRKKLCCTGGKHFSTFFSAALNCSFLFIHLFVHRSSLPKRSMLEKDLIERFSNEYRKTNTKANSTMNQSQFLVIACISLDQTVGNIALTRCDWFRFCSSLVEKQARNF